MNMFPLHLVETCNLHFELMSAFSHYPVTKLQIAFQYCHFHGISSNLLKKPKSHLIKYVQLPNKSFILR